MLHTDIWPAAGQCRRILLTGFRASGKSLVGKILARRLDWNFVDTDDLLCERLGCSITEMVTRHGWPWFRERERALLEELATSQELVLATGGGAVQHQDAWTMLRRSGTSVWLRAREETLVRRLQADTGNRTQRPALTDADPAEEIQRVLAARIPLYQRGADFVVDTDDRDPDEIAGAIITRLRAFQHTRIQEQQPCSPEHNKQ